MIASTPVTVFTAPPHPPVYYAHEIHHPLTIDGNVIGNSVWERTPWSTPFSEIRGKHCNDNNQSPPLDMTPEFHHCQTRVKILWDNGYLYIAALLEYGMDDDVVPDIVRDDSTRVTEIAASYIERNSPIYQQDSDFEVFVDADGSCHNYKELEVNALNTVWNLMLDRPYRDGGVEHSARVCKDKDSPNYFEVSGQKTAVKLVRGRINDSSSGSRAWTVEIALAHEDTLQHNIGMKKTSLLHNFWRISFSRVEWKGQINWTWAPQLVWDTKLKKFRGVVEMHRPEAWGYVYFTNDDDDDSTDNDATMWQDPLHTAKAVAIMLYHELHQYNDTNAKFTQNENNELGLRDILNSVPFDICIALPSSDTFLISVTDTNEGGTVCVTNDRKFTVTTYR